MAEHLPDPTRDDETPDPEPTPGPGDSVGHYELADHPDELDDGPAPPPAVPGPVPTPVTAAGPDAPAPATAPGAAQPAAGGDIPRCPNCHQDITGSMLGGNCPHCGKRITADQFAGQQSSGNAVASLVLGILSIPACIGCSMGLLNIILGALAIHFSRKAKQQIAEGLAPPTSEGMAIAGYVCGVIGLVLGFILTLIYALTNILAFALEF